MNMSSWGRKVFASSIIVCQILLSIPTVGAQTFADVNPSDWFYIYTEQLASAGIVSTTTGRYFPFQPLTRAELAKMAVKSAEFQRFLVASNDQQARFCDVSSRDWAMPYVQTLSLRGVVQGSQANCNQRKNFLPNNKITRAEAVKILLGIYGVAPQGTSNFSDVERGSWYEPYIATATRIGLVNGYNNGNFGPHAFLTRAEMSKIIVKLTEFASAHPELIRIPSLATEDEENENEDEDEEEDDDEDDEDEEEEDNNTPQPTTSSSPTPTQSSTPTPPQTSGNNLPSGALTFYALGDSLTEGQRDETEMGGYPPRLQSKIEAERSGSRVITLGQSGNDSSNVANDQLPTVLHGDADAALILIGSNDMWADCWNEGNDTSAGTISNYEDNMETIMSRLANARVKIYVGLVDDQSRRPDAPNVCTSSAGRTRMSRIATAFNNIIRTKASTYHATVVDFASSTIFTSSSTLSDDGNHPNAAGYEAMARLWFGAIEPHL